MLIYNAIYLHFESKLLLESLCRYYLNNGDQERVNIMLQTKLDFLIVKAKVSYGVLTLWLKCVQLSIFLHNGVVT